MRTRLLIIAGITVTLATVFFVLGPSQGHIAEYFLNDEQFEEIILNNNNEDRYSAHDESFADESKVTGNMAQEICSITGGECPPNYFANILDDGSKMVGITISDTVIEKQFVFIIENNTLSYTKTIYENGNRRLDCNTPDDPHKEYQCFKNAFSNCQLAKVDPDQYTIEGSPIFTNVTITSDCKIYGIIDTTTDVHGDRGITVSAITVMTITVVFSIISWFLFSWASRNIKFIGIPLGVIAGASLVISFLQVLGPMAGVIVGIVAGFVAFMIQKKIVDSTQNTSLVIAAIIIVVTYFVLTLMILAVQTPTHVWDTGDGIGAWTGTADRMEPRLEIGGDTIDLDPDLSPSYALDFAMGSVYYTIMPLVGLFVGISALFLTPYFILKRKNIPSRPYLALMLVGILLFFTIPNFVSSLEFMPYLISQHEQIRPYIFEQIVFQMWWQIVIVTIVGILLYRSSVIRKLIKK